MGLHAVPPPPALTECKEIPFVRGRSRLTRIRGERRSEAETKPARTPYLHVRTVEGFLLGEAIAITGNAKALLQLRAQIDRALRGVGSHPFEEGVYRDANGIPFEVAAKRVRSKGEMGEPVPKPQMTAEELPWVKKATGTIEKGSASESQG